MLRQGLVHLIRRLNWGLVCSGPSRLSLPDLVERVTGHDSPPKSRASVK